MVTINFELDKRRQKKNGLYPLKLRLIYRRRLYRYSTYIDLSTEDHSLLCSDNIDEGLICVRQKITDLELKV
jgi:hypothetical protein